jgi:hypothetical protein
VHDFADGSTHVRDLSAQEVDGETRYQPVPPAATGDYYAIQLDGALVMGDDEGVILTLDPP